MAIIGMIFGGLIVLGFIIMAIAAILVDRDGSTDFPEGGYEDRT